MIVADESVDGNIVAHLEASGYRILYISSSILPELLT